jgi:phosphatidylglycerophosphate synthase
MSIDTTKRADGFREAQRHLAGLTARGEKRALRFLASRTPGWITSDHLTLLGLASAAACGALYAASGRHPWLILVVNLALALNWLGDSLDGTLARHRGVERPRFGFYVDHLVDAFGALFLLGGLAFSGLMSPLVAAAVLSAYFLLAIETYLATYTIGRFEISYGPFGGTELRILLAVANGFVLRRPLWNVGGIEWLAFDVLGAGAATVLAILAVVAGIRGTRALVRLEGWAPGGERRRAPERPHSDPRSSRGKRYRRCERETEEVLPGGLFSPPGPPRCITSSSRPPAP